MAAPRQLTPSPRNRALLPTQISVADLSPDELAEFIEPAELPNEPLAFDVADYDPE